MKRTFIFILVFFITVSGFSGGEGFYLLYLSEKALKQGTAIWQGAKQWKKEFIGYSNYMAKAMGYDMIGIKTYNSVYGYIESVGKPAYSFGGEIGNINNLTSTLQEQLKYIYNNKTPALKTLDNIKNNVITLTKDSGENINSIQNNFNKLSQNEKLTGLTEDLSPHLKGITNSYEDIDSTGKNVIKKADELQRLIIGNLTWNDFKKAYEIYTGKKISDAEAQREFRKMQKYKTSRKMYLSYLFRKKMDLEASLEDFKIKTSDFIDKDNQQINTITENITGLPLGKGEAGVFGSVGMMKKYKNYMEQEMGVGSSMRIDDENFLRGIGLNE